MKKYAGLLLILAGCSSGPSIEPITLADGSQGMALRCDGEDPAACPKLAGQTCPRGYTPIDERTEATPYQLEGIGAGIEYSRTMIIKCR